MSVRHYVLLLLQFFCFLLVKGQQPAPTAVSATADRLNLVSSNSGKINAKTGHMVFYRPVYEHKGSTLSADSGYIYEDEIKRQFFEAFGNVVITQPNGTTIFADRLHYDAAPQLATLTNNVKMVDGSSTLTTNYLRYNMRAKVGTYTGGGRIVTQSDTITSKNGYYFETTKDAYFRNSVVVRNPSVKIYTDTMRYNSAQRMTYFFGPTNIKGNKAENLYTEKGDYNMANGVAKFSKNNLYTEGTKFLKGDSLYYERDKGVGKAYRNVVFVDTLDKFYAYGGFGVYDQGEESITMTEKPLIITVLNNDSTETKKADVDSLDSSKPLSRRERKRLEKEQEEATKDSTLQSNLTAQDSLLTSTRKAPAVDSVFMTADTLFSKMILLKDYKALDLKLSRDGGQLVVEQDVDYGDEDDDSFTDSLSMSDSLDLKQDSLLTQDSLALSADSSSVVKELVKAIPDTVKKAVAAEKPVATAVKKDIKTNIKKVAKPSPESSSIAHTLKQDSILRQEAVIPKGSEADDLINKALVVAQSPDSIAKDSSATNYLDTARTRIVKAYHNVRMFKTDLQAVADSVYYGMADSMFRFMGRPMIWAQGSQISSDTIFMQIINQKMDNALLKDNAFMVNAVLDTVKFNQLKGRKITAFFSNNNIDRLFVDGNAENLVFSADDSTKIITEMFHDRGARIKVEMEGKKVTDYYTIQKVDQKVYPFKLVTQENEILPGFIWLPQDRPKSKEDMINRKRAIAAPPTTAADSTSDSTAVAPPDFGEPEDSSSPPENKAAEILETETLKAAADSSSSDSSSLPKNMPAAIPAAAQSKGPATKLLKKEAPQQQPPLKPEGSSPLQNKAFTHA